MSTLVRIPTTITKAQLRISNCGYICFFYSESRLYSFKDSIKVFALIKTDFVKSLENTIF